MNSCWPLHFIAKFISVLKALPSNIPPSIEKHVSKSIEPYQTTLSANNAYWMAQLSKLSYVELPDDRPDEVTILETLITEDENFISVTGESQNTAQAILVEHKDYFCLAFRGTDELADWLDNLNALPEKALFGEFHHGFVDSVEDVWEKTFQ